MFIWIFVHLRNQFNVRPIEHFIICLYSEGGEDRFVVVHHSWCRKICQAVCRVSRKWIVSKLLDQDVDVVFLANKGIVIGCFVERNYNKTLTETGKLMTPMTLMKTNPYCSMPSALIKATYNDYFSIWHLTDNLSSLSKEIQYRATRAHHLPLVTLLSYTKNTI